MSSFILALSLSVILLMGYMAYTLDELKTEQQDLVNRQHKQEALTVEENIIIKELITEAKKEYYEEIHEEFNDSVGYHNVQF